MILLNLASVLFLAAPSHHHRHVPSRMQAWRAGQDVSGDFQRLEQAIRYSEKDFRLIYQERERVLRQFPTQQRQLWRPWLRNTVIAPWMAAVLLSWVKVPFQPSWQSLLRVQFFTCVVGTPLVILFFQRLKKRDSTPTTPTTTSETIMWKRRVPELGDLRTCLLEQWTTAVVGVLLLGPTISSSGRVLVRLAAMCSVFQFPKLQYELQETQRPVDGLSYWIQKAVAMLVSPWWMAAEIGFSGFPSAVLWGTSAALGLLYAYPSLVEHRNVIAKSFGLGVLGRYYFRRETILSTMKWLATFRALPNRMAFLWTYGRLAGPWLVSAVAFLGPLIHIVAFSKLIQVKLMNNVALTMNATQMEAALKKSPSWYSSLQWREPKRIGLAIRTAKERWMYNYLFAGSVDEQLRQERRRLRRKEELDGKRVWERLEFSNSTQWKDNAMKRMADQHQHDYEKGTYEDPLGVAVYKTLGVGLGFNYDHMSETSVIPETRRLQSRAAKSAVRRVQELYGRNSEILKDLPDDKEKLRKTLEMKIQMERETDALAKRLSELLPTDLGLNNTNAELRQIDTKKYERISAHEYRVAEPRPVTTSPVTKVLLENMPGNHSEDDDMEEWERQMTTLFEDNEDETTPKTYMA